MSENLNVTMIEQMKEALSQTRAQLRDMETEYNRLRAQVAAYEQSIRNLEALESGQYKNLVADSAEAAPTVRKGSGALKENIYEYFKGHPNMVQSPKRLTEWLVEEKGWEDEGLRPRISNLLRKIVKEESWLNRAGHGKYQFVADA